MRATVKDLKLPEKYSSWLTPKGMLKASLSPEQKVEITQARLDALGRGVTILTKSIDNVTTDLLDVQCNSCSNQFKSAGYKLITTKRPCPCPLCRNTYATEYFIARAEKTHNNKYDYCQVEYTNSHTKVTIVCPEHQAFQQAPWSHQAGNGCPRCWEARRTDTKEEFISKASEVHGDLYDYSLVDYKNNRTKVTIVCPEHGTFLQLAGSHTSGHGCPNCKDDVSRSTKEEFIAKARDAHGDLYNYDQVEYINNVTKVTIVCPEHQAFRQSPINHTSGNGCPRCAGQSHDTLYLWNIESTDIWKIGITTKPLLHQRTLKVASEQGVIRGKVISYTTGETTRELERYLLAKYTNNPMTCGDGYTEFRVLTPVDILDIKHHVESVLAA